MKQLRVCLATSVPWSPATMWLVTVALVAVAARPTGAADDDSRCKCVCPPKPAHNSTEPKPSIYITSTGPEDCTCEFVLRRLGGDAEFCPRCECKYEVRKVATIKVVVVTIICVISILFTYMLFLTCLDTTMNRRAPLGYEPQGNEDTLSATSSDPNLAVAGLSGRGLPPNPPPAGSSGLRIIGGDSSVINRVQMEQGKWQRQVREQRRSVFVRRTLLN